MKQQSLTTYGLEEQKIAQGLKQQPDVELLYRVKTLEQFACWLYKRLFYECISESWQLLYKVVVSSTMRDLLEAGLIDETFYNHAGLTALFLQRTWELVVFSFDDCIRPELVRLGVSDRIQTPFDFFGQIVCYESYTGFSRCLKPFYNFQARKQSKIYRAAVNALADGKPLPAVEDSPNPGINLLLTVCEPKATSNNPVLKSSFKAFKAALIDLYDYSAKYCWHTRSFQWNKGHYERGNKNGIYQPLNKT